MDRNKVNFWVDILMFIDFLIMAISGFILWFVYPAGKGSGGKAGVRFLLDRFGWMEIHKLLAVIFLVLVVIHLLLHFNWIKAMFKKSFSRKTKVVENVENIKNVKDV